MSGAVPATKCTSRCPTSKAALWPIGMTGSICNSGTAGLRAGRAIGERTGLVATEHPVNEHAKNSNGLRNDPGGTGDAGAVYPGFKLCPGRRALRTRRQEALLAAGFILQRLVLCWPRRPARLSDQRLLSR